MHGPDGVNEAISAFHLSRFSKIIGDKSKTFAGDLYSYCLAGRIQRSAPEAAKYTSLAFQRSSIKPRDTQS